MTEEQKRIVGECLYEPEPPPVSTTTKVKALVLILLLLFFVLKVAGVL